MKQNPFSFSCDNKRYHTLSYYNKTTYGAKIHKAVLDCGFTCPNIDGTKGFGGCIFCDSGSGYFTDGTLDVSTQLKKETARIINKHGKDAKIIAYFQANTNTYASAERLQCLYDTVLETPNIHGISIGTRADCLQDEVMKVIENLNNKTNLTVELGLQSVHDPTIKFINRCCTHAEFLEGYYRLKASGIRTCLHLINGLPGESEEMMLETAAQTAQLHPNAVKIQMLHIIRGTKLAEIYESSPFSLLSKEDYIRITSKQLELLPPETVIERITGDGDKTKLIAPLWSMDKISVLGGIDKFQAENDTWQGKEYKPIF